MCYSKFWKNFLILILIESFLHSWILSLESWSWFLRSWILNLDSRLSSWVLNSLFKRRILQWRSCKNPYRFCKCLVKDFFWESIWQWSSFGISLIVFWEDKTFLSSKTLSSISSQVTHIYRPLMDIQNPNDKMWLLAIFLENPLW